MVMQQTSVIHHHFKVRFDGFLGTDKAVVGKRDAVRSCSSKRNCFGGHVDGRGILFGNVCLNPEWGEAMGSIGTVYDSTGLRVVDSCVFLTGFRDIIVFSGVGQHAHLQSISLLR